MLVPTPGQPRRDDTRSLWNQPVDTAEFLGLLSFGESGRIREVIGLQQQQQREFPLMAGRMLVTCPERQIFGPRARPPARGRRC